MLSDLALELINEIVNTLLKNLYINHDVTSGYNPTINGKQEIINCVIIDTLRKLSENIPTAIKNLRNQLDYWNNVFKAFLSPGLFVMIRNEGMIN